MNIASYFSLSDAEMNKSQCNSQYKKTISSAFAETSVMLVITMVFTSLFSYLLYLLSGWVKTSASDPSSSIDTIMCYVSLGVFVINTIAAVVTSYNLCEDYSSMSEAKRIKYRWIVIALNSLLLSFISLYFDCFYSMLVLLACILAFLQLCKIYCDKAASALSCFGRWVFMLLLATLMAFVLCLIFPSGLFIIMFILMLFLIYSIDKQVRMVRSFMLKNSNKAFNIPWIAVTMATFIYAITFIIVIEIMSETEIK